MPSGSLGLDSLEDDNDFMVREIVARVVFLSRAYFNLGISLGRQGARLVASLSLSLERDFTCSPRLCFFL